uniref:Uncharacterized protein n=1 Tax=Vespula pensylvanica TaxID=30213 RepID=A0A834U3S3_VESPE|nr:hypothetical protein H0235_012014 [Vespula pensylvanica]
MLTAKGSESITVVTISLDARVEISTNYKLTNLELGDSSVDYFHGISECVAYTERERANFAIELSRRQWQSARALDVFSRRVVKVEL